MATGVTEGYSSVVLEHFRRPLNRRRLEGANATAEGANPLCGDRIRIEARVASSKVVTEVAFTGDACAICVAAASLLSDHVTGRPLRDVMTISTPRIIDWLDGSVPATRIRCASLPLDTLHRALTPFVPVAPARPVILAAGAGTRFGGDKLTATVDGEPLLRGVVASYVAMCGHVTVVARAPGQFAELLEGLPVTFVVNSDADEGIASSIRAAVTACSDRPAIMIALGDEPRVDRALVARVLDCWLETKAAAVMPRYGSVPGHPVLFDRSCFTDLLTLHGDVGARGIVRALRDQVQFIDIDQPPPIDIDRPEDLRAL